jgi:hypothetical protein
MLQASGLAELMEGWLLVGWDWDGTAIRIRALLFDKQRKFKSEVDLPGSSIKPPNTHTAPTRFAYTPSVVSAADGTLFVLSGFTDQPIYRFSAKGELLGSIKLKPDGVGFWSPRLLSNRLFVQAEVSPVRLGTIGSIPLVHGRSVFAVFSMQTGEIIEVMTLDGQDTGVVGCYAESGPTLTLINQEFDRESFWVIQTLKPASPRSRSRTE